MLAPAASAARATAGFIVSIEIKILLVGRDLARLCVGVLRFGLDRVSPHRELISIANFSMTGITRRNSSASLTGFAPGRVDSPPMSRISAPCATSSSACATAFSALKNFPPSEKESGVTLTMPMTSAGRGKRNSNCRAQKSIQLFVAADVSPLIILAVEVRADSRRLLR